MRVYIKPLAQWLTHCKYSINNNAKRLLNLVAQALDFNTLKNIFRSFFVYKSIRLDI